MALLDRVATLVRANLNDLVDRAENPEKMLKQVILDMENQFMQVKTQVAIALADLHLLEKRKKENADKHAEWMRKAELAVDKKDDELARAALERAMSFQHLTESFEQQIADQETQVESLKSALKKLELKLSEARARPIADRAASPLACGKPRRRGANRAQRREPHLRAHADEGRARRGHGPRHTARCWATTSMAGSTRWSARTKLLRCCRRSKTGSGSARSKLYRHNARVQDGRSDPLFS